MKCHFCQKLCRKVTDSKRMYWQCDYHGSVPVKQYEQWNDFHNVTELHVYLTYLHKDIKYYANFIYHSYKEEKFLLTREMAIPQHYPNIQEIILRLDFHPDITPDNFEKKLPTLLTFL